MVSLPQVPIDPQKEPDMCFVCGCNNPIGLKLSFRREGANAVAEFTPTKLHQGWSGIVHGGIIHTLLDEGMSYAALFEGAICITAKMQSRWRRPAMVGEPLVITSWITRNTRRLLEVEAAITLRDGTTIAESTGTMYVVKKRRSPPPAMTSGKPRGAIWDMDGVIVDSAPHHFKAWQKVFQERGVPFTETDFKKKFGQRNDTIIKYTLGEDTPAETIEEIAREKEETFRRLARENIRPLPGAVGLIRALRENGFRTAISSSAPFQNIRLVTETLGIQGCFDAVVSGHEVREGKPSPEGFLLAARRLGVEPERCIVFEDAVAGVEACLRAGMRCVALTSSHPAAALSAAHMVIDTLESVTIDDLVKLIDEN